MVNGGLKAAAILAKENSFGQQGDSFVRYQGLPDTNGRPISLSNRQFWDAIPSQKATDRLDRVFLAYLPTCGILRQQYYGFQFHS